MGREELVGSQSSGNDRSSCFRLAGEDAADVDEIIADHAESNPALHAAVPFVPATVEPVAALHYADASFTASPPFLPVLEPGLLLFLLPIGALGVAIGNADAFDSLFVRRLFVAGRVEGSIRGDQVRNASQLLLVGFDRRN